MDIVFSSALLDQMVMIGSRDYPLSHNSKLLLSGLHLVWRGAAQEGLSLSLTGQCTPEATLVVSYIFTVQFTVVETLF